MPLSAPVYVLSLPGSKRRECMVEKMANISLPFTFFDGVRIHTWEDAEREASELGCSLVKESFEKRLKGEVGILIAYLKFAKFMIDHDLEEAVLFEDDVSFTGDIIEFLKEPVLYFTQWNRKIAHYSRRYRSRRKLVPVDIGDYNLIYLHPYAAFGTQGQYFKKEAAMALFDARHILLDMDQFMAIDCAIFGNRVPGLQWTTPLKCHFPHVCFQEAPFDDIHTSEKVAISAS